MPEITAAMIKELRERTGAGFMDCKKALQETQGDMDKAIDYLREKGLAAAAKKAGRIAAEGLVDAYIHLGGRVGVLIEVNCETDFVAKTDAFKQFVKDRQCRLRQRSYSMFPGRSSPNRLLSMKGDLSCSCIE